MRLRLKYSLEKKQQQIEKNCVVNVNVWMCCGRENYGKGEQKKNCGREKLKIFANYILNPVTKKQLVTNVIILLTL